LSDGIFTAMGESYIIYKVMCESRNLDSNGCDRWNYPAMCERWHTYGDE